MVGHETKNLEGMLSLHTTDLEFEGDWSSAVKDGLT